MVHNLGLLQMHLCMQLNSTWRLAYMQKKSVLNLHIQRFIVMSNPKLLPLLRIAHCLKLGVLNECEILKQKIWKFGIADSKSILILSVVK